MRIAAILTSTQPRRINDGVAQNQILDKEYDLEKRPLFVSLGAACNAATWRYYPINTLDLHSYQITSRELLAERGKPSKLIAGLTVWYAYWCCRWWYWHELGLSAYGR